MDTTHETAFWAGILCARGALYEHKKGLRLTLRADPALLEGALDHFGVGHIKNGTWHVSYKDAPDVIRKCSPYLRGSFATFAYRRMEIANTHSSTHG
jgi:hypothetical protein